MPRFPTRQPKKPNKGRVDFRPEEFRLAILQKGQPVLWEMVAPCPCVRRMDEGGLSGTTGEHRVDCPECQNHPGFIYHSAQQITALAHGAKINPRRFELYGDYAHGMASFTLLPEHLPAFLDRFTVLSSVAVYTEIRVRTKPAVEAARYPIVKRTFVVGDETDPTEPDEITVGVIYARRAASDGVIFANAMVENTDFVVDDEGRIDWSLGDAAGTSPPVGGRYTVAYYAHPVYVVQNSPHTHRDTFTAEKASPPAFVPLPVQADCWLEFLGEGPNG